MERREFLKTAIGIVGFAAMSRPGRSAAVKSEIMTVRGGIPPDSLGVALPHEHLLVDFSGADKASKGRYDPDEVVEVVLPYLEQARELGVQSLAECSPEYLGRDPVVLKRLSEASGVHILTATGYYGAASKKFVPAHAYSESADQLASRWIKECKEGIEDTGIRPGFLKTGTDAGPLAEINQKLIRAAARTHLATGLTIASHTTGGVAATEELDILTEEGVNSSAFIWVHAQSEKDESFHLKAAEKGAGLEFDAIRPQPQPMRRHLELVTSMKEHGLLNQVLLSHDAGWYSIGEPRGGSFRPFDTLFTKFIPALKEEGFTEAEIKQLTVTNPRDAFTVRTRGLT